MNSVKSNPQYLISGLAHQVAPLGEEEHSLPLVADQLLAAYRQVENNQELFICPRCLCDIQDYFIY